MTITISWRVNSTYQIQVLGFEQDLICLNVAALRWQLVNTFGISVDQVEQTMYALCCDDEVIVELVRAAA